MAAEGELAKLEAQVLAAGSVRGWLASVDRLRVLLATESPDIRAAVLALVAPRVESTALAAVTAAFSIGLDDALAIIDEPDVEDAMSKARPSKATIALVGGLDAAGRKALADAKTLLNAGADVTTYLAPVFGHANRVRGTVSDVVTTSGNEAIARAAEVADYPLVWVAETNACVHCLAYSGQVAEPGEAFPGGRTYGKKSYHPDPLKTPPLHPRCRCTLEPLNDPSYAAALRREADRSVLRGFSLESESMKTRVDAAERLLAGGVNAPKSVIAYARRAVADGTFTTRGR
jgi:hypothetical protein